VPGPLINFTLFCSFIDNADIADANTLMTTRTYFRCMCRLVSCFDPCCVRVRQVFLIGVFLILYNVVLEKVFESGASIVVIRFDLDTKCCI
jgi:hypothetical protein